MLKRIRVKGYKSLEDVEVSLRPLSVLLGPNAAGKSNFLDVLQLLSRLVTTRTLKEAFEPPYRGQPLESLTFGQDGIRGLLNKPSVRFSIEVDVEISRSVKQSVERQIREMKGSPGTEEHQARTASEEHKYIRETSLRYRIEVEILPKSGVIRVADEYLTALNAKGEPTKKRSAFIERVNNRIHLRMEGQAHPTYYENNMDRAVLSQPHYPPHYPHLVAMREELASWLFFYFEPRERMRAPNPVKEVHHIGLMGEDLAAFLNTLKNLDERQFQAVEKAMQAIIPSVTGLDVSVNDLGEVELKIREGDTLIPARVVSEGTLRVLGLLALSGAKEPPALIGFEEPENGIHPRRIQLIAKMLETRATGNTQIVLTTHSPILPDLIPGEDLFICRKKNGRTSIFPFASQGDLFKPLDIDSALTEPIASETSISERMLRGDFDA